MYILNITCYWLRRVRAQISIYFFAISLHNYRYIYNTSTCLTNVKHSLPVLRSRQYRSSFVPQQWEGARLT